MWKRFKEYFKGLDLLVAQRDCHRDISASRLQSIEELNAVITEQEAEISRLYEMWINAVEDVLND